MSAIHLFLDKKVTLFDVSGNIIDTEVTVDDPGRNDLRLDISQIDQPFDGWFEITAPDGETLIFTSSIVKSSKKRTSC